LKIWQQNLRKSSGAWEHMLKNLNPNESNIASIQEPYLNPVKLADASNLKQFWDILYPINHHISPEQLQVIMPINKKLLKTNWYIVLIKLPNIMSIKLTGNFRFQKSTYIQHL
ncbi:hypothetical protein BDR03DRAFT_883531, partial [Suillus americanus]